MGDLSEKCALGMYTVWKSAAEDLYGTFRKVSDMGYKGIEYYGAPTADLSVLKRALGDSGLTLTGWFTEWQFLMEDTIYDTIDYLQKADCPIAVIPGLGGKWNVGHRVEEECKDVWLRHIEKINEINRIFKKEGIRLGYHNHDHEFRLAYDGKPVFDLIFDELSEDVILELDSGNCIEGGDDPLRILKKYQNRDMLLHMKPYSKSAGFETVLGDADDCNDWRALFANKEYLWLLVESENETLPELEKAELCLKGFKKYLSYRRNII